MSESETKPEMASRRHLLRWLGLSAVGAVAVLAAGSLVRAEAKSSSGSKAKTPQASSPAQGADATAPVAQATSASASVLTVKVLYFQMPQLPTTQDSFVLQSPATYTDLLSDVLAKYPVMVPMVPTMMVFINGYTAQPGSPLKDGDEVDFIPAIAGG